ncbi:hypothetical protein A5715_00620 [Mycolicibacter heraklionensis]|nr:hypothetical protein A5715_00620 [Mycolicibacter heraklionensis]
MTGRAVTAAYTDTGANEISCPHCGAEPGQACVKPDARISKVPCVGRIAAADLFIDTGKKGHLQDAAVPVDYSEPRRPREAS